MGMDLGEQPRGVEVGGTGTVTAAPDAARISVGVEVIEPELSAARAEAARQAAAVVEAGKALGIPPAHIRTSRFSVAPVRQYDDKGGVARITGYQVHNDVAVTVRNLDHVTRVLDAVVEAGGNQVSGPDFFILSPDALSDEARTLAIADARRKAETLATAAGATLGKVLSIVESEPGFAPMPRMAYAKMAAADAATPIEAGSEEVAVSVRVRWEMV